MKLSFAKKDKIAMAAGILLIILMIVFAQFYVLNPLKSDLEMKQQSLQSEQKILDTLSKNRAANTVKHTAMDTRELQKQVPVKPQEQELILDLEKAETLSSSQIQSMSFTSGGDVAAGTVQTGAANAQTQPNTATQANANQSTNQNSGPATQNTGNAGQSAASANQSTANTGTANKPAANPQAATLNPQSSAAAPAGLKKLTVSLSVQSPNYQQFEKFIETLESLKRIAVVEQINYSGGQELTTTASNQQSEPLTYTLTVSAFYMPGLTDLQAQLPTIDAPAPAGKSDPLVQYPVVINK